MTARYPIELVGHPDFVECPGSTRSRYREYRTQGYFNGVPQPIIVIRCEECGRLFGDYAYFNHHGTFLSHKKVKKGDREDD